MEFQRLGTVEIGLTIKHDTVSVDPATSILVTVTDPAGTSVVTAQAMTKDSTGTYHYNYTIAADAVLGWYRARVTATDGAVVTIQDESFEVTA